MEGRWVRGWWSQLLTVPENVDGVGGVGIGLALAATDLLAWAGSAKAGG